MAYGSYFWVNGFNSTTGQEVLGGPYSSREQAELGSENITQAKIYPLGTVDRQEAARAINNLKNGGRQFATPAITSSVSDDDEVEDDEIEDEEIEDEEIDD